MRPVSQDFLDALHGSHRIATRARIVTSWQTGVDPPGVEVPIVSGNIASDPSADVRSTADVTVAGAWPDDPDGLFAPYGNEIFLERGIVLGNGDIEYCSLGYFRIYTVEQSDTPAGTLRISGRDRMSGIIDARLTRPVQFAVGTSFGDAVAFLVREVYPRANIVYDFNQFTVAFDAPYIAEEDRYGFLLDMVTSQGKVMYWDYEGNLRIEDPPNPEQPVWTVNHGEDGILMSMGRSLDRDGVYNAVVASGETPGDHEPVQAIARDMNPASPTYWLGRFGKVPRFYTSPFITTEAQAESAARSILAREIGLPYAIDFTTVVNPALEPLDPVEITYSDRALPEVHVVTNVTIPLAADQSMSTNTREQTRTTVEVETA